MKENWIAKSFIISKVSKKISLSRRKLENPEGNLYKFIQNRSDIRDVFGKTLPGYEIHTFHGRKSFNEI